MLKVVLANGFGSDTREILRDVRDLEERVYALETRLTRVVGVRRVE